MTILEDTLPGSYAGVPCLVITDTVAGGRKKIIKQFPNSDVQSIEDLGLKTRTFTEEIIITGDQDGNNYIANRDNFLRVLEKGGDDVLIHPLFGRITDVAVLEYTLTQAFSALGEARFSVTFSRNTANGLPVPIGDTITIVSNAIEQAIGLVSDDAVESFNVSSFFPNNFTAAVAKINKVVEAFNNNASFLSVGATEIDAFADELGQLASNVTGLVSRPRELIDSILSVFQTLNGLYSSIPATFEVVQKFFSFGDSDNVSPIIPTTVGLVEREANQRTLNYYVKTIALLLNYENASATTYTTIDAVNTAAQILEDQYTDIAANGIFNVETLDALNAIRNNVQAFFNAQKLTASDIVPVQTPVIPTRVLAF